jgi:hypothetical protein
MLGGMSKEGFAPAVVATAGLWLGQSLLLHFGRHYLDPGLGVYGLAGAAFLAGAAPAAVLLVRRADYPWLMFVAAAALPLFEPQSRPDTLAWRLFSGLFGLALVIVAVLAFVRMAARNDELERRINQEALAFAFAATLVLVMAWSVFQAQDLLPPVRGNWVACGMIVGWLVGWNAAVRRYR